MVGLDAAAAEGVTWYHRGLRHLKYRRRSYAGSLGMDVLLTDHHIGGEILPDAVAVINPKLEERWVSFPSPGWLRVAAKCAGHSVSR